MLSLNASALFAASSLITIPRSTASCFIFAKPSAPSDSIGNNCVPERPKISCANAARFVGSSTFAIAIASISNCWSGFLPFSWSIDNPNACNGSLALSSPLSASVSTFAIRFTPTSSPSMDVSDNFAAWDNCIMFSTDIPVLSAIFAAASPAFAYVLIAMPNEAVIAAPAAVTAAPIFLNCASCPLTNPSVLVNDCCIDASNCFVSAFNVTSNCPIVFSAIRFSPRHPSIP